MSPDRLNALLAPPPGVPDAALLRRYIDDRDEAAFELLVRRHAAAVWRVCRAVASDHHAAEDAFQVTFLALARKAATVRTPVLVGWLCRVAHRAALKTRRRWVEALAFEPAVPSHEPDDTAAVLHAELDKLPDAERLPVLLCHLSGYTQAQAAAALGLPLGTVAARVSRACGKLRDRLIRRGVTLSVAGVTAALGTATAGEPLVLRALAFGTAETVVPQVLTTLLHEVTSAMRPTLLRTLAVSGLAALLVAGAVFVPVAADDPKPAPKAAAPKPVPEAELKAKLQLIQGKRHLEQVAEAYRQYVFIYGKVPTDVTDANGKALLSWRVHLLPFMEQNNVYRLVKFDSPWDSPENLEVSKVMFKVFITDGPLYVHKDFKDWGTRIRRIGGPTGANADFAAPPAKLDLDARQAVFGRFRASDYPVIIEAGIPTPWLKPDEDFEFDPKAKAVKLLGAHEAGTLVATAEKNVKLVLPEPDAATFADWMTKGAKATIEPAKLYPPVGKLTEADKAVADLVRDEHARILQTTLELEEKRLRLQQQLVAPKVPAGDPDPQKLGLLLERTERLLREGRDFEGEINRLEAELKLREKK